MVFTQADLATMAGQRPQLDKLTDEKQMEIPNAIFAVYLARSIALHAYALEVLRQPLDFNGHERFQGCGPRLDGNQTKRRCATCGAGA
jgi:hypothetical protein